MYIFKENISAPEHDEFVRNHALNNLLQSSSWAQVKENWSTSIVGVYDDDILVASTLVLIKTLPLGYTLFYTPRGPILDYEDKELVYFFMTQLKKYAKKKKCVFIKMDPGIHIKDYPIQSPSDQSYDVSNILDNMKHANALHKGYVNAMKDAIQPRFQANVYNSDTFEESLPRHTKRLLRDAIKHDVQVVRADCTRIDDFANVVASTEERKQVHLRNHGYFKRLMEIYGEDASLYLAQVNITSSLETLYKQQKLLQEELETIDEKSRKKLQRIQDQITSTNKSIQEFESFASISSETIVIAGVLSVRFGDTVEMLYAGLDDRFKKFMPQYLLYVEQMKDAFSQGYSYCNMGGVEGDLADGLSKFKANFNPMINEFIGEFDLPVSTILYPLYNFIYTIYKKRK